ncbi:cell division protein FtsZ [Sediminibacterium goheungense]|uniref:Cell division protein FtsZ n=1 Tax=Sediminibacterium goheungense TaxID=1086393 RepID=A0A4R6IX59_9BACT|nr:cell division protein FtsZ [Sediminibacterium goheungense]TDO26971.1 cell division protein FtsZ [Sediminibacterium goheungense]
MIHFDLPKQKSSIIKVLGVGGGGSNAVNFMFDQNIEGVDFIICNTDAKAIEQSKIPNKIQLGPHLTQGLGAGANPEVGKKATEESLEEIKRILEVNTKMAFITVGMGGGTGTGGAPIIAQICKELGILTVGIVTTPFGFEGPRRQLQADEGIRQLKPYVDTLLVISNDKLRIQYGNLKMKEAFAKADNVLATAAKCITDVINSRGHIIVDFADVCTVMKNGGVAILGKAEVEGENRAQLAIEEALSSPLLNDNDIRGAKWILININSAEGDHECTMDELETINNFLRMQAGEDTDVIVGMGYDNTLDKKIGITLIATGFEHKDPFAKPIEEKKPEPRQEKIVMTLDVEQPEAKPVQQPVQQTLPLEDKDPFAPRMEEVVEEVPAINFFATTPVVPEAPVEEASVENFTLQFELSTEITEEVFVPELPKEEVHVSKTIVQDQMLQFTVNEQPQQPASTTMFSKPMNIYAEPEMPAPAPVQEIKAAIPVVEEKPVVQEEEMLMKLVEKEEKPAQAPVITPASFIDDSVLDDAEEQKRRAAERIQKLRNLSFNMNNSSEANSEFDNVPAYVRRNMELFGNTLTSVEDFYSKYTVGKDENNQTQISTINTFLDGKKPD